MIFTAMNEDGSSVQFKDTKRWLWLVSLALPLTMTVFLGLYSIHPNTWVLSVPFAFFFFGMPLLDMWIGGDTENPPEAIAAKMSQDKFYDNLAYCVIPANFVLFITAVWLVGAHSLPLWSLVLLVLGVGTINGNLINIGHELGHKTDKRNRFMAKIALGMSGYGHFTIEHNRGHHLKVATPEDCASSRYGESVYAFALRELPGAFKGGWALEKARLAKRNLPIWHWKNEILQVYALNLAITASLVLWLGWHVLPFITLHHAVSYYSLTQVNYIEHYGLLRQKRDNGKYEPCQPRHSWNSNHRVSNLLSLHLQRHSDHHANPRRPYQALRDFDDVPVLPSGYPGCLALASIPPLWFKVMNPRVMDWAGGDMSKINTG